MFLVIIKTIFVTVKNVRMLFAVVLHSWKGENVTFNNKIIKFWHSHKCENVICSSFGIVGKARMLLVITKITKLWQN